MNKPLNPHLSLCCLTTTALLCLTLSGCGYHLRGSPALYGSIKSGSDSQSRRLIETPIRLSYPKREREWAARLRTQFERANIKIVEMEIEGSESTSGDSLPQPAPQQREVHNINRTYEANRPNPSSNTAYSKGSTFPTLTLLKSEQSRRIASYTSRAKAAEYTLTERLSYHITNASDVLIVPTLTLSSDRVYEFNVNNISGKDQEASLIAEELKADITLKLIRHLYNIAPQLNQPAAASTVNAIDDDSSDNGALDNGINIHSISSQ